MDPVGLHPLVMDLSCHLSPVRPIDASESQKLRSIVIKDSMALSMLSCKSIRAESHWRCRDLSGAVRHRTDRLYEGIRNVVTRMFCRVEGCGLTDRFVVECRINRLQKRYSSPLHPNLSTRARLYAYSYEVKRA